MSQQSERGFTLAEVMIAVILLGVGVMALVSSSAMATRMIGRGKESTMAAQVGSANIEALRQLAASTDPTCTAVRFRTDSITDVASHVTAKWVVPNAGTARNVVLYLTYRAGRRQVVDTGYTTIYCPS